MIRETMQKEGKEDLAFRRTVCGVTFVFGIDNMGI